MDAMASGFFCRQSGRRLLVIVFVLTLTAQESRSDPPPDAIVKNLTAVIADRCPDAQFETSDRKFTAKHGTMRFTTHRRSKTGEWFPATDEQEGPNFRGFLLTLSVEKGKYQGPAAIPQTISGPYFSTFIDGPATEDGNHYYWVTFSYGSQLDPQLREAIVAAIPRSRVAHVAATTDDGASWWLQVAAANKTHRVRPDGSSWSEIAPVADRVNLSPDGKRKVYTDLSQNGKRLSEVFVADVDGQNVTRLTDNDSQDYFPSWSPDGKRIVFTSDRSGHSQVYAMDADGANVEQLTDEVEGAQTPKLAPDGRLAYLAMRKRQGKVWFQDLIVRDGATSHALVKDAWLYGDYAWSPDGKTIAYGKIGGLVFHDFASGEKQLIDFAQQIDPQMKSHAAFNLAWRPDGQAVACSIMFFGGRSAGGPKMIGDEEIFVIPRQGRPSWFTSQVLRNNPPRALAWVRQD